MRFAVYFLFSLIALVTVVAYAVHTRSQFFPILLFLTSSKISFLIWGNMIIAVAILAGKISKSVFLGSLRDAELEILMEKAKYSIFETCLALTIFRNELSAPILLFFGLLLFVKSFHWLAKSRFEYLEQVIPLSVWTYVRFSGLLIALMLADISIAYASARYTIYHGKSVVMLFGFEFGLLLISVTNLSSRYVLFLLDNRLANGLPSKGLYAMIIDLICEACKCIIYFAFFCLLFSNYGLPIHIIREVWMAFHNFQRKLSSFFKYLRLTNNLDQRFETATPEEIAAAGDCLICREAMESGKKLPCSHVFHLDCLRMWLQHQQSCPLCRADIPTDNAQHHRHHHRDHVPPNQPIIQQLGDDIVDQQINQAHDINRQVPNVAPVMIGNPGLNISPRNATNSHDPALRNNKPLIVPNLYLCQSSVDIPVRLSPSLSSQIVRKLKQNSIIFVKEVSVITVDSQAPPELWYQIPGGWIHNSDPQCQFTLHVLGSEFFSGRLKNHNILNSRFCRILGSVAAEKFENDEPNNTQSAYDDRVGDLSEKSRSIFRQPFSEDIPDTNPSTNDLVRSSNEVSDKISMLLEITTDLQMKNNQMKAQLDIQMKLLETLLEQNRIKDFRLNDPNAVEENINNEALEVAKEVHAPTSKQLLGMKAIGSEMSDQTIS